MRMHLLVAIAALVPCVAGAQAGSSRTTGPRVRTSAGTVEGIVDSSGVREFRGIPYAAPPVRELRWRPPQPAGRWTGTRKADRFADQCMQARIFGDMVFRNAGVSEDCLYLNVWMPPAAAAKPDGGAPVLVYFYGGGFVAGDGSEPRYDGESMARRGIVVVTMSYRLGIFGFFSHPALTAESAHHASGNYALMDQTAALRWVRDNIAAFGGDPKQVTIAGESAGSFSVSAQMASPLAKGLFARAIGESGAFFSSTLSTPALAETEQNGTKFANALGAPTLGALRALSAMELLAASGRQDLPRFGANVDGWFFPEVPADLFAQGKQAKVPLLAGWNSEESSARGVMQETPDSASVGALLARMFGDRAGEAAKVFPAATPEEALQSMTDLASDRFIGYSTWKWLDVHGRTSGQPVYRYLYARPRPATVATSGPGAALAGRGAVHSAEIEYALGNLGTNKVFAWTADDYKVSAMMQEYFANFIRTGNPNGPGLPEWPAGNVGADGQVQRMRIDVQSRAEPEPRARYLFLDQAAGARR
ncbi:MAG: carboxylesterase family protein [Gemmatimonadaceae bacterium]|nr:carboxylesterase family protein [Gemmatimonadaceae bacterium]